MPNWSRNPGRLHRGEHPAQLLVPEHPVEAVEIALDQPVQLSPGIPRLLPEHAAHLPLRRGRCVVGAPDVIDQVDLADQILARPVIRTWVSCSSIAMEPLVQRVGRGVHSLLSLASALSVPAAHGPPRRIERLTPSPKRPTRSGLPFGACPAAVAARLGGRGRAATSRAPADPAPSCAGAGRMVKARAEEGGPGSGGTSHQYWVSDSMSLFESRLFGRRCVRTGRASARSSRQAFSRDPCARAGDGTIACSDYCRAVRGAQK